MSNRTDSTKGDGRNPSKIVNANADTTDVVKVTMGKGFRFGATARSAELVA